MAAEDQKKNNEDLGLGSKVIQGNRTRFVNRDGTFNVHRKGMFERGAFSPYHAILQASWTRFFWGVIAYYISANVIFTAFYLLCGKNAFPAIATLDVSQRAGQLFFYSIQIISTLGSSPLHPATTLSDIALALESMIGLFGFAIGASLMFARFSNPPTRILFSKKAVIAPYNNIKAFMVRIINGRSNELINVNAIVTVSLTDAEGKRAFQRLALERDSVYVFPLSWTIVHPIEADSPLWGLTAADLKKREAEFLVNISATDEDLSKTVYARSSYLYDEVAVGAKFVNILENDANGAVVVDPKRIGEIEKV